MGSIKVELKAQRRKLKALVCLFSCLLILASAPAKAQTFQEWWNQKSTQKKYLVQQIAALQIYIGYLQKGYQVVNSGLNTVKDITNGEFHLHDAYISSLKQVNPVVRNDKRVDEIVAMQEYISQAFAKISNNGSISLDQNAYVASVKAQVLSECSSDMDELVLVITAGKVEMTDDERPKRLNKVYLSMQDKTAFTQHFCNQVAILIRQWADEIESIKRLRRYDEGN